MEKSLYIVVLGGKYKQKRMLLEAHKIVFVVASSTLGAMSKARSKAKTNWDVLDIHVDSVRKIDLVDGYKVCIE